MNSSTQSPDTSAWTTGGNSTAAEMEGEDLMFHEIIWTVIVWIVSTLLQIWLLIPFCLRFALLLLIFVRFFLVSCRKSPAAPESPSLTGARASVTVRLVSASVQKICCLNLCLVCDYLTSLRDVKMTRSKLAIHVRKMKVGIWVNEADSDDEMPYRPMPQEEVLVREVNYELANIVDT